METTEDPVGWIVPSIGEEPIVALVASFYRQVPADDVLGPMYPKDDLAGAEARLRDFLLQRFGGPARYTERRGHPRLRMRHAAFPIDLRARDRWMERMSVALDESGIPDAARSAIREFLDGVATFLVNR